MGRKSELINLLEGYKKQYAALQKQVAETRSSTAYTEEGRSQRIAKLVDGFASTAEQCHDRAAGLVEAALAAMSEKWRQGSTGKIQDAGYQAGLANTIKMLEMGAVREKEDIQNIIDSFTGDFNALAVIRKVLERSSDEELAALAALVPKDNREYSRRLLGQLKTNMDRDISTQAARDALYSQYNQDFDPVPMGIEGMLQFITDRLDDNLELL